MEYREVIFLQDYTLDTEDRKIFENLLNDGPSKELFDFLSQWDYEEGEMKDRKPWGTSDDIETFKVNNQIFVVSVNCGLGYASLTEIMFDYPTSFDRFDIVEAYYQYYSDYYSGQTSKEYEKLCRISKYFKPSPFLNFDNLSTNSKGIYLKLAKRIDPECKPWE